MTDRIRLLIVDDEVRFIETLSRRLGLRDSDERDDGDERDAHGTSGHDGPHQITRSVVRLAALGSSVWPPSKKMNALCTADPSR